ncbi:MAG: FAD:protein FMN transferase [Bdellovibrionota bacterium]
MATTFELTIGHCSNGDLRRAEATLREALHIIKTLENELSEFLEHSPVSRLNRSRPHTKIQVPESVIELLELSLRLRAQTGGAFDCLAKSTTPLYMAQEDLVSWSASNRTVWKNTEGAHLGFGAIGKGYALDKIRPLLEREGFYHYILSAGGSSQIISGFRSDDAAWSWGWSWAQDEEQNPLGIRFSHPSGSAIAIGVSGLHEKGFHLIDPRTKQKAETAASTLVAKRSAAEADALSTALFVLGWEQGLPKMARSDYPDQPTAVAAIDRQGTPRWNGPFQKLWGALATICLIFIAPLAQAQQQEEALDLGGLGDVGLEIFNPYLFERNSAWVLLPLLTLGMLLLHLRRMNRRKRNDR